VPNFNVAKFIDLVNALMGEVKEEDMFVYEEDDDNDHKAKNEKD
jgi:hypothetical protein